MVNKVKGTQVQKKSISPKKREVISPKKPEVISPKKPEVCPWLCNLVPTNVPGPGAAQSVLHPGKDVFVLKVAKVGPNGDRHCKMELELVTPKGPDKNVPSRYDTRDSQCDPDPPTCMCCAKAKKKRK